jgi:hypothetical protein
MEKELNGKRTQWERNSMGEKLNDMRKKVETTESGCH